MRFRRVPSVIVGIFPGVLARQGSHRPGLRNVSSNGAPRAPRQHRGAWSLMEVLVVFAILGVLLGLGLVVLTRMREQANVLKCKSNLRDLALAVHNYHAAHGHMPPYASGRMKEIYGSWFVHLMPYVEQQAVYETLVKGQRTQDQNGLRLFTDGRYLPGVHGVHFQLLLCPSDPTHIPSDDAATNYLANWYAFTDDNRGFYRPAQRFSELTDGLTNVVLFGEGYSECNGLPRLALYSTHYHNFGVTQHGAPSDDPYYAPADYTMFQVRPAVCDPWRAQTPHSEMNVALADGSVQAISPSISDTNWKYALKPRDGHNMPD